MSDAEKHRRARHTYAQRHNRFVVGTVVRIDLIMCPLANRLALGFFNVGHHSNHILANLAPAFRGITPDIMVTDVSARGDVNI